VRPGAVPGPGKQPTLALQLAIEDARDPDRKALDARDSARRSLASASKCRWSRCIEKCTRTATASSHELE